MQRFLLPCCQPGMRYKTVPLFILLVLLLPACKKDLTFSGLLTVNPEDCVQRKSGSESLSICLDAIVQDSRCPINANCVWQGVAVAQFTFSLNGKKHQLELATNNVMPGTRTDTIIQQYHISFKNLHPYPGEAAGENTYAEVAIEKR